MASSSRASEEARARALVGTTVDDRYRFDEVIATGAMGTVYLARHLKLKKRVAIKVLHPGVEDHPELVLRFEREALAGAQVAHANVAAATDFGDLEGGARYLVMEYVRGKTLRAVLDAEAPLAPERAVRIARQLALALGHLHEHGMVHRDVKPRNVMLAADDFVKLVDLGLAKIDGARLSTLPEDEAEEDARLTGRGVIFGTVEYLAPEAAFGMELVDHRADLYALGVVLYEMLTGKHPFEAKTEPELFAKQRHAPAPAMKERNPDVSVPAPLEAVVQKLLQKDFDERYQTASEVGAALEAAMPSAVAVPPPPPSVEVPPSVPPPAGSPSSAPPPAGSPSSAPPPASAQLGEEAARVPPGARPSTGRKAPARPPRKEPSSGRLVGPIAIVGVAVALLFAFHLQQPDEDPAAAPSAAASTARSAAPTRASPRPPATPRAPAVPVAPEVPASAASAQPSADPALIRATLDRLRLAMLEGRWDEAADELLALLRADPRALRDASVSGAASELLVALAKERHARADEVWRAVALGDGGPDLLYRYVESHGKAAWAERARKLLADPAVVSGTSAAVRVAFELREAACDEKLALLDRAVREGDQRAALVIDIIVRGCVKDERPVDAALKKLRARLAKR